MSQDSLQKPYKQRFKGIENFLRRVAFNLGNTASQTEVKIISCIPIDVTDLQQKIINLEKQLHESKQQSGPGSAPGLENATSGTAPAPGNKRATSDSKPAVVNTAIFGTTYSKRSSTVSYASDKLQCGECTSRPRKSNVSFVFPALSSPLRSEQPCSFSSRENVEPEVNRNGAATERYMNIFKKRKRKRAGKSNLKTHLVYFAQQDHSNPFNTNEIIVNHFKTLNDNADLISHTYLDNVIRKQYDPNFVIDEFSDTSQFSKPICRDTDPNHTRQCESVCSCCHGRFQNVDNYMTKSFDPMNRLTQYERDNTCKTYYDSNLYDVIPVRENTNKYIKDVMDIECWPENYRSKYRYNPLIVNYQTDIPQKRRADKLAPQKTKLKKAILEQSKNGKLISKPEQAETETSKSCCVDCSDIYQKYIFPPAKLQKSEPVKTIVLKNELIETDDINPTLILHNQSTQLELIPEDRVTESTLNQIKSILQSVLAEVKTSTKVANAPEKTPKKDAFVQKGASQNNMQGDSTLLHSFTYNDSYNANPNLASCSRQVPAGQYCFTGIPYQLPGKCHQNYPVFIHPATGRAMCACYYRNSSHKPSTNKQATTAATNTDEAIHRPSSKETEKLIKEIYKSMALTMDFPGKDNSASEYDDLRSAEITNESAERITKDVKSKGIGGTDKRDIEVEALISPNLSNNSKLVYTATSSQSEDQGRTNETQPYDKSIKYDTNHYRIVNRRADANTIIEDDEETAVSSESENYDSRDYYITPKNEKKSLLQRMFKSVKIFRRKKANQNLQNDEISETTDDSDENVTIYSGRTGKKIQQTSPRQSHKPKINFEMRQAEQNAVPEKSKRLPYLEQEYRRQWNEQLMFDKLQEKKYSSDRPYSKQSAPKNSNPVYWNNYEARSAIVRPNFPSELNNLNSDTIVNKDLKRDTAVKPLKKLGTAKENLNWLKKHKLGIHCGDQWKKFILES